MYEGQGEIENGMIKVTPERQQSLGVRTSSRGGESHFADSAHFRPDRGR